MREPSPYQSCPYSPHEGPVVECLPAPNIFPLAKETFAKGKMFWNETPSTSSIFIYNTDKTPSSTSTFTIHMSGHEPPKNLEH